REVGALFHAEKYQHSYMHCWRHKTPIIYRATTQWFAGMDDVPGWRGHKPTETLRATALRGIDATQFYPSWGKSRLYGMIAHRTVMGGPNGRKTGAGSRRLDTGFPADLYLEGSDQHRGWFHSSLLVSCMLNGVPPYKALLTHGFVVDGEGRKMSKSKGNVVAP